MPDKKIYKFIGQKKGNNLRNLNLRFPFHYDDNNQAIRENHL